MQSLPISKIDQIEVGSNIAQNHSLYLIIYLPQFTCKVDQIWVCLIFVPQYTICALIYLYFPYLALIIYIYLDLPIFAHISLIGHIYP